MDFFDLPLETRTLVYRKMTPRDVLHMRLTCRQAKQEIDNHVHFHVRLDQNFKGYRKLLRLRIESCSIVNMTSKSIVSKRLLHFPLKLKKLALDGSIAKRILTLILSHCVNLDTLIVCHDALQIEGLFNKNVDNRLPNLTTLSIQMLRHPFDNPFMLNSNIETLLACKFKNLRTFKCYSSLCGNLLPLIRFCTSHAVTLRQLTLHIGDRSDQNFVSESLSTRYAKNELQKLHDYFEALKSLELKYFELKDDLLDMSPKFLEVWMCVLSAQQTLEHFSFSSPGDITEDFIELLVLNNHKYLKEFKCGNIKHIILFPQNQEVKQFDLHAFSNCIKLKLLSLACISSSVPYVSLTNLKTLPATLKKLEISGYKFDIEDLDHFLKSVTCLEEVSIFDAGEMRYALLLYNIFKVSTIKSISITPVLNSCAGLSKSNSLYDDFLLSIVYERFMKTLYDPLDELDGFEASIESSKDRQWLSENVLSIPLFDG